MTQLYSPLNPVYSKDVNSDNVKGELVAIRNELQLVKNEFEAVKGILTDGGQKVQLSGTIVANTESDLPSVGYMGQVALVKDGKRVFIYDGSEWGEW